MPIFLSSLKYLNMQMSCMEQYSLINACRGDDTRVKRIYFTSGFAWSDYRSERRYRAKAARKSKRAKAALFSRWDETWLWRTPSAKNASPEHLWNFIKGSGQVAWEESEDVRNPGADATVFYADTIFQEKKDHNLLEINLNISRII